VAVQTTSTTFGRRVPAATALAKAGRSGAPSSYAASVALDAATQWNRPREATMQSITVGSDTDAWTPPVRAVVAAPAGRQGILDLLFSAEGRMRRRDYWMVGMGANVAFLVVAIGLAVSLAPLQALIAVLPFAFIYIRVRSCAKIKRWHDRDKGAIWTMIVLAPFIGAMWAFVECGFLEGTRGDNRFGPPPK
jgi:uncharacterized membrane protein YhaH (DUF805 family)